ncbi:MAG: hypothetical protein KC492_30070, partial [Myxococcales bacterium]|nr:hypothetical protein [Myxococcales bacterium]
MPSLRKPLSADQTSHADGRWRGSPWVVTSFCGWATLTLSGCPAPIPPVHVHVSGGAATETPGREKQPDEQLLGYTARVGVNPLGYTKAYDHDPVFDIGVGYELEQLPFAEDIPTSHGPYASFEYWPDLKPRTEERLGVRLYGEFFMLEPTGGREGPGPMRRAYGYGGTLAFAWEGTGSTQTGLWKRERSAPVLGYGRAAFGLFVGPSLRHFDDQTYVMVMVGGSLR